MGSVPPLISRRSSSSKLLLGSRAPCSSKASLLGINGRASPKQIYSPNKSSTNLSIQPSQYMPILFLTFNLLLLTQKGYSKVQISGALTVSLKKTRVRAVRYLQSLSPKQSQQIYLLTPICNILNKRHKNLVGFLAPPQSPPMHLSSTALSIRVKEFRAKHFYFQYLLLNMRLRVVLSISCVMFFYDICS